MEATTMRKNDARDEFSRVCDLLPQLSPRELAQVRLRTRFLSDDEPTPADDRDWLLRGVEDELRRRGAIGRGGLMAEKVAPGWGKKSESVRADLLTALGGEVDRRELASFGQLVARCLATYLSGGGVPPSPKTMLKNADKALLAVDAQFPGYAQAGLLRCVLDPALVGAA